MVKVVCESGHTLMQGKSCKSRPGFVRRIPGYSRTELDVIWSSLSRIFCIKSHRNKPPACMKNAVRASELDRNSQQLMGTLGLS